MGTSYLNSMGKIVMKTLFHYINYPKLIPSGQEMTQDAFLFTRTPFIYKFSQNIYCQALNIFVFVSAQTGSNERYRIQSVSKASPIFF